MGHIRQLFILLFYFLYWFTIYKSYTTNDRRALLKAKSLVVSNIGILHMLSEESYSTLYMYIYINIYIYLNLYWIWPKIACTFFTYVNTNVKKQKQNNLLCILDTCLARNPFEALSGLDLFRSCEWTTVFLSFVVLEARQVPGVHS